MPKILPKASTIEERWIEKLRELDPGMELYVQVENKKEQTARAKVFRELIAKLDRSEPIFASRIVITPLARDRKLWLMLKLKDSSPLVGFSKDAEGRVARVDITIDTQRERKIALMYHDGFTPEEMAEVLDYPPTREELAKARRSKK